MRWIVGVLLALVMSGEAVAQVQVQDDKFSASATFSGPKKAINPFGGTFRMWSIRAWIDKKTGIVTEQLYVDTTYLGHWRFWETAANDQAEPLEVVTIDRSVGSCSGMCDYSESFGVTLPNDYVRQHAAVGFQIKVNAKSGDYLILDIAPEQILPVLNAMDAYKAASTAVGPGTNAALAAGPAPQATAPGAPHLLGVKFLSWMLGGALIVTVEPGSVADRAGIVAGDVVKQFDGKPIAGKDALVEAVRGETAGRSVPIDIVRSNKPLKLTAQF